MSNNLIDMIEYDLDSILQMETDALLRQLIFRHELFFPKRKGELDSGKFKAEVAATVSDFVETLSPLVPELAAQVDSKLQEWMSK